MKLDSLHRLGPGGIELKPMRLGYSLFLLLCISAIDHAAGFPTLEKVLEQLQGRDQPAQLAAIQVLAKIRDPRAVDALIHCLSDRDWQIRSGAAYALGRLKAPSAVPPLIDCMKDEKPEVRMSAAFALGSIGDPSAAQALLAAFHDQDRRCRYSAAQAAGSLPGDSVRDLLIELIASRDFELRRLGVRALSFSGDPRNIPVFLALCDDEHREIQPDIAEALSIIGATAIPPLLSLLNDPDPSRFDCAKTALLRLRKNDAALRALRKAYPQASGPAKRVVLQSMGAYASHPATKKVFLKAVRDPDPNIRGTAALALAQSYPSQAIPYLIASLPEGDQTIRTAAITKLWQLNAKAAVEPLIMLLNDPNRSIRQAAIHALGQLRDPRAIEPILTQVGDADPNTMLAIGNALSRINDPRAVEPLLLLLDRNDIQGKDTIIRTLGYLKDRRAVGLLIPLARQGNFDAIRALGEIGDPRAIEPLMKQLQRTDKTSPWANTALALGRLHADQATRLIADHLKNETDQMALKTAADALGLIGTPEALAPLLGLAEDERWQVRQCAVRALGGFKDDRAYQAIVTALRLDNEWVRETAASALGEMADPRGVTPLLTAVCDAEDQVACAAIESLVKIKDRRAMKPLIEMHLQGRIRCYEAFLDYVKTITGKDMLELTAEEWTAWWRKNRKKYPE
jgi:HEAT repeat protein